MMKDECKCTKRKKVIYYLDELSVFFFCLLAVIFSDIIQEGVDHPCDKFCFSSINFTGIIISSLMAIVTYGSMYTKFKYNDKSKPAYIKRVANAILTGLAWRSVVGMGMKS